MENFSKSNIKIVDWILSKEYNKFDIVFFKPDFDLNTDDQSLQQNGLTGFNAFSFNEKLQKNISEPIVFNVICHDDSGSMRGSRQANAITGFRNWLDDTGPENIFGGYVINNGGLFFTLKQSHDNIITGGEDDTGPSNRRTGFWNSDATNNFSTINDTYRNSTDGMDAYFFMGQCGASGGTNMQDPIYDAFLDLIETRKVRGHKQIDIWRLFVLSDGFPNSGSSQGGIRAMMCIARGCGILSYFIGFAGFPNIVAARGSSANISYANFAADPHANRPNPINANSYSRQMVEISWVEPTTNIPRSVQANIMTEGDSAGQNILNLNAIETAVNLDVNFTDDDGNPRVPPSELMWVEAAGNSLIITPNVDNLNIAITNRVIPQRHQFTHDITFNFADDFDFTTLGAVEFTLNIAAGNAANQSQTFTTDANPTDEAAFSADLQSKINGILNSFTNPVERDSTSIIVSGPLPTTVNNVIQATTLTFDDTATNLGTNAIQISTTQTRDPVIGPNIPTAVNNAGNASDVSLPHGYPPNADGSAPTVATAFLTANNAATLETELNSVAREPILERIEPLLENEGDADALLCRSRGGLHPGNAVNAPSPEAQAREAAVKNWVHLNYILYSKSTNEGDTPTVAQIEEAGYPAGTPTTEGQIGLLSPTVNLFLAVSTRYTAWRNAAYDLVTEFLINREDDN